MVANSAVHLTVLQRSSVKSAEDSRSSGAAVEDEDDTVVEEVASGDGDDTRPRESSHGGVGGRGALLAGLEHELTEGLIPSVRMPIAVDSRGGKRREQIVIATHERFIESISNAAWPRDRSAKFVEE